VILAASIVLSIGLKPSIDFTGGSLTEVRYTTLPDKEVVEGAIADLNIGSASVRYSNSDVGGGYLISTRDLTEDERTKLSEKLIGLNEVGKFLALHQLVQ